MSVNFGCSGCGHRQDADRACARCGSDTVHDLRSRRTRELFADIDSRLRDRRTDRIRMLSVVLGMGIVIAAWFIPGWWDARGRVYPGIPLFADQIIFMTLIALGIHALLDRVWTKQRFPYLDTLPPADRD